MSDRRRQIEAALKAAITQPTKQAAVELFQALGYASNKTIDLDGKPETFLSFADPIGSLSGKLAAQTNKWRRVDFIFQLTNDEIPVLAQGNPNLPHGRQQYRTSIIESFVFLAIELEGNEWSRSALAGILREINRLFPMPVLILFRYADLASLGVIDRRPNKKDTSRDVVIGKRISIIKDIRLASPHRAHVEILVDIALSNVKVRGRGSPTNFRDLYDGWIEALSAQTLNTRFYGELANWFFWSVKQVTFPAAALEKDERKRDEQNQIAVIRLLTRIIFVWFIKEKALVPEELFEPDRLRILLKEDPANHDEDSTYYKAVLQNLFFATLNTEMSEDRKWRTKRSGGSLDGQYLIHTVYRYKEAFRDPAEALRQFRQIPFLNGGLFECLDREVSSRDLERNPALMGRARKEGSRLVMRVDGFSERPDNPLHVPNKIFFARDVKVNLNAEYDTKGKSYRADGLIELFSRYKFTVEENTPVEEEVALDPELLGKVFENLLASHNPDTKITARKKSGSFYTPREVVDYMVDEALVACFARRLMAAELAEWGRIKPTNQSFDFGTARGELDFPRPVSPPPSRAASTVIYDERLRNLLSFKESENPFSDTETDILISAIDDLKALDPACGSGAFPMGLLQKLIHVLHRLDPNNSRWKAKNRKPFEDRLAAAKQVPDPSRREGEIEDAEAALKKLEHDFSDANRPDYARKLYLIDKCLFGVDIQPIAVQIAKLRFFISLVVSQKIDRAKDNANITALPNLETKLVAADSLIPIERPAQVDLFRDKKIADTETELRGMNERYFSARTMRTKRKYRDEIGRLRDELADLLRSDRGLPESDARKMAAWDPFDQNTAAPFFDPEWMFGLASNFDLVIGNPPYVRHESIKEQKPSLAKHYGGKDKNGNPLGAYSGTADLFVYFIQRGIELLNPGGAFAYIISNKWYRAKYGELLRGWMSRNTQLRRIIDFGDAEVFDAIAYPTIVIAVRRDTPVQAPKESDLVRVMNWPVDRDRSEVEGFPALVDAIGFDMPQKALLASGWQLEPQAKRGLLDRIRAAGMPLREFVESRVYRGVTTGFNDAFVVDETTKNKLIASHKDSATIFRPYLRGADITRWQAGRSDLWIIKIPSSENVTHPWSDAKDAEAVFAKTFPSIFEHINGYREQLIKRHDQGKFFWEMRSCTYWDDFENLKLLSTKVSFRPSFCVDRSGAIIGNTAYFIKAGNFDNFLMILLNSNVSEYYSRRVFSTKQGGFYEVQPGGLEAFPVPPLTKLQSRLLNKIKYAIFVSHAIRIEQLLNGFIYELFFETDLHAQGLTIFKEAEAAGLSELVDLEGRELINRAEAFAKTHLSPGARLHTMLSDLQTLDVVRIVEGRE